LELRREIPCQEQRVIPATASTSGNDLLAALPSRERENLLQLGETVALAQDEVLCNPGERIRHAWFPLDGFIALLAEVDGHDALAVSLVGSEGMLGAPLVLGVHSSSLRARAQGAGSALRIKSADFLRVLAAAPILERHLLRYLAGRLEQLAQTAACASFHVVEARLACWMLMAHDRAHGDRFTLTHERLSRLLGVRRSGVSTAAGVLQGRGLIEYTRGRIVILDRAGLERAACACYGRDRDEVAPVGVAVVARGGEAVARDLAPAPAPPQASVLPLLRVAPHRR
jgi:CRP-like cAMP-binding protein